MNTIEYYLQCPYRLEIIPDVDEGGYVASYPELSGCITVGKTLDDAVKNAEDAKREWLIAALNSNWKIILLFRTQQLLSILDNLSYVFQRVFIDL